MAVPVHMAGGVHLEMTGAGCFDGCWELTCDV
jgi:hypothetical protein